MKKSKGFAALFLVAMLVTLLLSSTFDQTTNVSASIPAWQPNTAYSVGQQVTYNGSVYQCLQAHTSQVGWEPPNVPALWQLVTAGTPTTTTNTPVATATAPPTTNAPPTATHVPATATPVPPTTTAGSGCSAAAYNSATAYTGGQQVTYNGHAWQAKWWTQGEAPSTGGSGVWVDLGSCGTAPTATPTPKPTTNTPTPTNAPTTTPTTPLPTATVPPSNGYEKVAYFDQWGIYGNAFYPKNLVTTGDANNLTTMIYAFENIDPVNLTCFETIKASDSSNESDPNAGDGAGDAFADYQKSYTADISVDGVADVYSQPIKGNFNQLKKLKAKYPNLKILLSLGGWTYSKYFSDVAATQASRQKFVSSCIDMFIKGNLPVVGGDPSGGPGSGAGIFDGFDLDWEFPGTAGHVGNHYGPQDTANFTALLAEFRSELNALGGKHYYLTAALSPGQDKIALYQTNQIGNYLDWGDLMTYDMHGGFETTGPTNFQSPIHEAANDPSKPVPPGNLKYSIDTAFKAFTQGLPAYNIPGGMPANQLVLGIPFYARGWTGVSAGSTNGVYQAATGPSPAFGTTQTAGIAAWKELVAAGLTSNISWDTTTQSSYVFNSGNFYTFDSPQAIGVKDQYIKSNGLRGGMAFSMEDDDPQATLFTAFANGLK